MLELGAFFLYFVCFFFNDTAPTEIYTLSLHDALPISCDRPWSRQNATASAAFCLDALHHLGRERQLGAELLHREAPQVAHQDRKSTRLNSSHVEISYAVFCLKKKKKNK